jgi:transcriptional regulator with XRE-family HTH domain
MLLSTTVYRIKQIRKACGVSLTELAERTGVHRMALARVERRTVEANTRTLAAIAKALRVPVCELFDDPAVRRHGAFRRPHRGA